MAEYLAFNEECWSRLTDNVIKGNYVLVIGKSGRHRDWNSQKASFLKPA